MQLRDNPEYESTLRRYCELLPLRYAGNLTPEQAEELQEADAALSAIEAEYYKYLRGLTNDYEFATGEAGNLGGVELL